MRKTRNQMAAEHRRRVGREFKKPTDERREARDGTPLTMSAVKKEIAKKSVKVVSTDRVNGGLRYNILRGTKRTPETLRVNADQMDR